MVFKTGFRVSTYYGEARAMEEMKVKRSIRRTVLIIFVVVMVISQLIVGIGTYARVSNVMTESQIASAEDLSDQIASSQLFGGL